MNIPNILTIIRIILIPFLVLVFYLPFNGNNYAAAIIFALAGFTDWLDGYLARAFNQTSDLGAFLDPVADKLVIAVALVLIVGEHQFPYIAIPAAVIVGREIVISALREWMAEIGKRASVAVSYVGKAKTMIQMLAVLLLLLYRPNGYQFIGYLGYFCLYIAAILTLWSMFMYLKTAWPNLSLTKPEGTEKTHPDS